MSPSADHPTTAGLISSESESLLSRISHLRGVRWRIHLCNLVCSSVDDLRRVTADSRRRYAALRRRLLVDPHMLEDGSGSPNLAMDNPLSENPDSMWGRFFRNAELEKLLDQDLLRLYPEHGSYFQTLGCQSMLRRILLLWCLRHPEYGYGQGMHELLAPLLYVLHADLQRLMEARKLHEDYFIDKFDDALFQENDLAYNFDFRRSSDFIESDAGFLEKVKKVVSLEELDPETQAIVLLSDVYGAEGELGVILSEKFMEHDVYCMFDALMSGAGGAVGMAEFFSPSNGIGSRTGSSPAVEASSALYHLLSVADSSLYSHLIELGVEPQYFALRWLRVLFGREFSLDNLLIIWDEIFSFENIKQCTASEDEPGSSTRVLNSLRGAFISAMAVSMVLNLRSSLLAAETATSCLLRLLNFPAKIPLTKLIKEAKSLLPLALDASTTFYRSTSGSYGVVELPFVRRHSLSFDSASLKVPIVSVAERYWEDKWRDLHNEDELGKEQTSNPKKGWTEKIKSTLYRRESDPSISPPKRDGKEEYQSSVRRSLFHDLSQHLEENIEDLKLNNSYQKGVLKVKSSGGLHDVQQNLGCSEKTYSGQTTVNGDSTVIPKPETFAKGSYTFVNESNVDNGTNVKAHNIVLVNSRSEDENTSSDQSDASISPGSDVRELAATGPTLKNKKSLSGKFQWLRKLGRPPTGEGNLENGKEPEFVKSINNGNQSQRSVILAQPAEQQNCSHVSEDGDPMEQNLIFTLKNLGQSMLENIEAIESVFQQEPHHSLSEDVILEDRVVTAMSALKELKKISNHLRDM